MVITGLTTGTVPPGGPSPKVGLGSWGRENTKKTYPKLNLFIKEVILHFDTSDS